VNFFDSLYAGRHALLSSLLTTASAGFWAIVAGTLVGVLLGVLLTYGHKYAAWPIRIYVDIVRGIPGLVMIFMSYYLLGFALNSAGITLGPWAAGVIALSIVGAADVAELTRGAFQSLPRGQIEAGKALGLRFSTNLRYVLAPQAALQMIPPWTNTATELIKGTTLLSLIGATELMLAANQLVATSGNALYFFLAIGLLFFVINSLIQMLARTAEKKLDYKRARRQK
jgi:polar amino acid transport system permease protein